MKGQIGDPRLSARLGPRRPKSIFRPAPPLNRRQNSHRGCVSTLRIERKLQGRTDWNEDACSSLALSQPELLTIVSRLSET